MKNLAIIPARIGSKRIPEKNKREFLGSPIISYVISAAKSSGIFDEIIVSTDSEEISLLANKLGVSAPILRPSELADDFTPTAPVLNHAVREMSLFDSIEIGFICCIYPTSVFVSSEILNNAFKLISDSSSGSCYGVVENDAPILRSLRINNEGFLELIWPEHELTRSQDLDKTYRDSGQFYFINYKRFLSENRIYFSDSIPIILEKYQAHDIDTPDDWIYAEFLYKNLKHK